MANGYETSLVGKVYHDGYPPRETFAREFTEFGQPEPGLRRPEKKFVETPGNHPLMDWGVFPPRDEDHPDFKIADWAVAKIKSKPAKPYFLAVGFRLPHVPCYASQHWFDLYPNESLIMPEVKDDDRNDVPEFSWYLHWKLPEPRLSWLRSSQQWQPLVRAYLASISFVDSQVARLLSALEESGAADNTIVVLWSDHGWHLGEKGISGKNSLWERSTRVPLVFAGPGIARGEVCGQPVELLDLYPTLAELCNITPPEHLQGHSLVAHLQNPRADREWPAISTHNQGNHAVRSERWRYIRYADGSEELYDMQRDPHEWTNLAGDPAMHDQLEQHRRWIPKPDVPPAAGSAARILTYDPRTGEAVWEGTLIDPSEADK
jgi:arylsulfatase A-like enzyme